MITINTRDYSINELKHLSAAFYAVKSNIIDSKECKAEMTCTPKCKAYAFCTDIRSTHAYINKKIRERETLEIPRDTQESE